MHSCRASIHCLIGPDTPTVLAAPVTLRHTNDVVRRAVHTQVFSVTGRAILLASDGKASSKGTTFTVRFWASPPSFWTCDDASVAAAAAGAPTTLPASTGVAWGATSASSSSTTTTRSPGGSAGGGGGGSAAGAAATRLGSVPVVLWLRVELDVTAAGLNEDLLAHTFARHVFEVS